MKFYAKMASIVVMLVLMLTLAAPAFASSTNAVLSMSSSTVAPVAAVTSTTASAALMPGDTGTIVVTIINTLKSPSAGNTTIHTDSCQTVYPLLNGSSMTQTGSDQTTSSDSPSGVASLKFVNLLSEGPVHVLNGPYTDVGKLGPGSATSPVGDSITFQFTIKVDSSATDGKYFLPLRVKTDSDEVYLNQVVPVIVDSTAPKMVVNDAPSKLSTSKSNIVIDVVNYRSGGITSVSVVPSGDEFSFKPRDEYIIGNIGANEMYTVTFETVSRNATYTGSPSFVLKYKNGDNWHLTAPMPVNVEPKADAAASGQSENDPTLLILLGIILVAIVVIGGIYLFMRSQRAKK